MGTREIENPDEEQIMMDFESTVNIITLLTLEIRHDESFLVSIYENLRFPILEAFKIFLENKNTGFSIYLHYKGKEEQEIELHPYAKKIKDSGLCLEEYCEQHP